MGADHDHDHLAENSSERRRRRAEGVPSQRAVAVQNLGTMLERDNEADLSKYMSSITSILGDSVATGIFGGDSVATASILGDISVATPYTYASRHSRRADARSDPPPFTRTVRENDGDDGDDRVFAIDGSYISRTGRRRGGASSTRKKLDPPSSPLRTRKGNVGHGRAPASARDGSAHASRHGKRGDSTAMQKKLEPPSSGLPVLKSNVEGNGRAGTSRKHGGASATPARHNNDGSGRDRAVRTSAAAAEETRSSSHAGDLVVRYQVGDTRAHSAHSLPFSSESQASALLARLPLQTPLFVKRSDRNFTYSVLVERRDNGSGGGTSLVVAMNEGGRRRKVLERRHWETCLRLVNTRVVDCAQCC